MKKSKRIETCCETCDNLIAVGEGGHICYEVRGADGNPIMPIDDYQPTEEYYLCGGKTWVNGDLTE